MSNSMSNWFNNQTPEQDMKMLAFGVVVLFAVIKLAFTPVETSGWTQVFYGLCGLVGLTGPALALADKLRGKNDGPGDGSRPG